MNTCYLNFTYYLLQQYYNTLGYKNSNSSWDNVFWRIKGVHWRYRGSLVSRQLSGHLCCRLSLMAHKMGWFVRVFVCACVVYGVSEGSSLGSSVSWLFFNTVQWHVMASAAEVTLIYALTTNQEWQISHTQRSDFDARVLRCYFKC